MPALLTAKTRLQMEHALAAGVPATVAAAALGFSHKVLSSWVVCGNESEEPPKKPKNVRQLIECQSGALKYSVSAGEYWQHQVECWKLVAAITRHEGTIVQKLSATMWKVAFNKSKGKAGIAADMQKFLFKSFAHVHRLSLKESAQGDKTSKTMEPADAVQIYVPDNGRAKA